jgi:hypothetical protein
MMVGVILALMLNFYPQHTSFAESDPAPGNACSWGFASVERSWWPPSNNGTTKLCDCTLVSYIIDGNHTPCQVQPE